MSQSLPKTRAELLALHAAARRRRDQAPLGGPEFREAAAEIATIEVHISQIEGPAERPAPKPAPAAKPAAAAKAAPAANAVPDAKAAPDAHASGA